MWAMAAVMTVGCGSASEEEVLPSPPPVQETSIALSGNLSDEATVTRAEGLEHHYTSFKVWAFKNTNDEYTESQTVMNGYYVNWIINSAGTSTTNSHDWEYVNQQPMGQIEQTVKYWDWTATAYRFFGVAGASSINPVTGAYKTHNPGTADEYQSYDLTYEADARQESSIPYYSHMWFSTGNTADYPGKEFGKPVQLQFIKPLSKVRFIFIFENPDDAATTELSGMDFRPSSKTTIKLIGKVTVSYPLTGTSTKEAFSATGEASGMTAMTKDYYKETDIREENGKVIAPYYGAEKGNYEKVYSVFPATNQGTYTLTVNINGEPKTTVVPAEFMNWLPGYSYTYIFKIHVDGSVTIDMVQSAFTAWTTHEADHTVYNW